MLSLLESSRPPRLPTGSWYYQGQLRKSRRWRQAAQAADVRDAGPGPERAQPGGFQSWILLPCVICLSIIPGLGRQTEGQSTGGSRAQPPLNLGNITAFQCQSHFKLISLCIMFFKSFLNKTKIQNVSLPWDVGTGSGSKSDVKKLLGEEVQGTLWYLGAAPCISSASQVIKCPHLQKAGLGGPLLLGSQEYRLIILGWHPAWWNKPLQEKYGQGHRGKVFSEVKVHGATTRNKSKSPVFSMKGQTGEVRPAALESSYQKPWPGSGSQ